MPINVSEALDTDTAEIITVSRNTGGYVDGVYQDGAPMVFKTLASMQQPSPKHMERLKPGQRDRNVILFISKKPLYTVADREGAPADTFTFKGKTYEVINAGDWSSYGHTTGMAAQI